MAEIGELWMRGTRGIQLFLEYYDNDEANAKAFTDDGWLRTGDLVRMGDDGNLFYCDRDKDALKVGGENVSAREVEDICRTVPGIADIAVVGKSHELLDMVPVAFVDANEMAARRGRDGRGDHRGLQGEPRRLQGAPGRVLRRRVPQGHARQGGQEPAPGDGGRVPGDRLMPYRVIQWATGNVGKSAIEGVLAHPELELVGVKVYSDDKDGVDVGEICGIDPVGVTATTDTEAILALDADCVVYSPVMADRR